MSGPVKIGAKLPKVDALNGLGTAHDALLREDGTALVVLRVEREKLITHRGGITEPVARIVRIEGIADEDADLVRTAEQLLNRARVRRAERAAAVGAPSEPIPGLVLDGDDAPPLGDRHPGPLGH